MFTQLIMIHLYEFSGSPYFSILPQVLHEMLIKFWIDDDYFIPLSAFKSFAHWTFRKKQKQCQGFWKNSLSCPVFGQPHLYLHSAPVSFKSYSFIFSGNTFICFSLTYFYCLAEISWIVWYCLGLKFGLRFCFQT